MSDGTAVSTAFEDAQDRGVVAFATAPVLAITGAVGLLLLLTSGRYGYHRDELYFIEAGRHPAWGYPDQPPLTPLLARLMDGVVPGSVSVLRLPSLAAAMLVVVLTALLAREFGGAAFAQMLSALVIGTGVYTLVVGHLLSTSTVDLLVWVTITWLIARILRTGGQRLWLAVGAVTGVGLLNKHLVLFLVAALLLAALLVPAARRQLRSPWLWGGVLLALALWIPNLLWQATHDWPQLTLAADIREEYDVAGERIAFVALQLVLFSPVAALLAALGLAQLWRYPGLQPYRLFAWAWLVLLVLFFLTGGKGYYLGGLYPALVAAGALWAERRVEGRRGLAVAWVSAAVAAALIGMPIALPILPAETLANSPYAGPAEDALETVGWPQLAAAVREASGDMAEDRRHGAVVFTGNYGEAGAVALFGRDGRLPPVVSGHNGFGLWGPPAADAGPVLLVDAGGGLEAEFDNCIAAATVDNGQGVDNEEQGATVWRCDGPRGGWEAAWPRLVHLDG
jgi:4-amino-4-deoxy-L-arabinose transferase-like glycosyltransferase